MPPGFVRGFSCKSDCQQPHQKGKKVRARRRRGDLWVTLALTLGGGEGINGRDIGADFLNVTRITSRKFSGLV